MEVRQSLNFDWAVRRDWKELERWVSSASSWVFSSWRRGTGRAVISTAWLVVLALFSCRILFAIAVLRIGELEGGGQGDLLWPGWPPCFEAMVRCVVVVARSFAGRWFVKVGGKFTWARFWRGGFGVG